MTRLLRAACARILGSVRAPFLHCIRRKIAFARCPLVKSYKRHGRHIPTSEQRTQSRKRPAIQGELYFNEVCVLVVFRGCDDQTLVSGRLGGYPEALLRCIPAITTFRPRSTILSSKNSKMTLLRSDRARSPAQHGIREAVNYCSLTFGSIPMSSSKL